MTLEAAIFKELPDLTINVQFKCACNALLAVTGPSGAGKTTVMRILAGLDRMDRGFIKCNGQVWTDTEKKIFLPARKRQVGYVFQESSLFPHLSVEKNVSFAARDRSLVERYLHHFHINHLRNRFPVYLSGGERQRVALAQALAREPKLLLLDEPFSALDEPTRQDLRMKLQNLKRHLDIPVIHITHNLGDAIIHSDSAIAVKRGKLSRAWLQMAKQGDLSGQGTEQLHVNKGCVSQEQLKERGIFSFLPRIFNGCS